MHLMRRLPLLPLLLLSISPALGWSVGASADQQIESDFLLPLSPVEVHRKILKNLNLELKNLPVAVPNFVVNDIVPVSVESISGNINFSSEKSSATSTGLLFEVAGLSADVNIGSLHFSQVITQVIHGITVNVTASGECHNIRLHVVDAAAKGSQSVLVNAQQNKILFKGESLSFHFSKPEVASLDLQCSGPVGLQNSVKNSVTKYFSNLEALQNSLIPGISNILSAKILQNTVDISGPFPIADSEMMKLSILDNQMILDGDHYSLRGKIRALFLHRLDSASPTEFHFKSPQVPMVVGKMAVPLEFLDAALRVWFLPNQWVMDTNLNLVPEFQALLNLSTAKKLLFWPDLIRFEITDLFRSQTTAQSPLQFSFADKQSLSIQGTLLAKMSAPLNGGLHEYVDFSLGLNLRIIFGINSGNNFSPQIPNKTQLNLQIASATATEVEYQWNQSYCLEAKKAESCGFILKSQILKQINQKLPGKTASIEIPNSQENSLIGLNLKSLEFDVGNGLLLLGLGD